MGRNEHTLGGQLPPLRPEAQPRFLEGRAGDGASPKILVVGGGMAAQRFLESLVKRMPPGAAQITILCEESSPPYDRLSLGEVVAGTGPARPLRDRDWYATHGIEVRSKEWAMEIDRASARVLTSNGAAIAYDRLVLATGSEAVRPALPGADGARVALYRSAEDAARIARMAATATRMVVVGGGLLGLEVADQLQSRGCAVTVLEAASRVLPRQLDTRGSLALMHTLRERGLELRVSTQIRTLAESDEGVCIALTEGATIASDGVVFAVGTRPRDDVAKAAGLDCHPTGGVRIDSGLATSDPAIFAIGECARLADQAFGLIPPCYRMADVLAERWMGGSSKFQGEPSDIRLKIAGIHVATHGAPLAKGSDVRELTWSGEGAYRRILLRDGRLVGAMAVGETADSPRMQEAVAQRMPLTPRHEARFEATGALWRSRGPESIEAWSDDAIVCSCAGVDCGTLRAARAAGHHSSAQLRAATGAGVGCGTCTPLLAEMAGEVSSGRRAGVGWGLPVAASVALALLLAAAALGPLPRARSVLETPAIDFLWRDAWWKQASGFALLAAMVGALLFSSRDRLPTALRTTFSKARIIHASVGVAILVLLGVHTGMRLGANLNAVLMACAIGSIAVGSLTGLAASLEQRLPARLGSALRRGSKQAHLWLFLPIPVLICFHVLSVYLY